MQIWLQKICEGEGKGIINRRTASKWFKRFREGDISLENKPHIPQQYTCEMSARLGPSKYTINRTLHMLLFVRKRPRQDPHDLTIAQSQRRVDICKRLLENTQDSVLEDRFGHKVVLSVWWNIDGIVHFELDGRAVNANLYSEQLGRVYKVLKTRYPALINRKRVLLQHDNAPAHRARLSTNRIKNLEGIEVLPHPTYSPDIAPSDYVLFHFMATFLRGNTLKHFKTSKLPVVTFSTPNPENGIVKKLKTWQNDGWLLLKMMRLAPGFNRHVKVKTSLQDDDVPTDDFDDKAALHVARNRTLKRYPIDDTMTKPLFTPQEKGRIGNRDKVPKTSMESLTEARQIHISNYNILQAVDHSSYKEESI
ncbi:TMEM67 [Cordylochernes scorpioides]|uniref:TMEM67 n=1 Tax=Cordylochernes scorpioides TaxID=51811 RepID=A0ABY6K428_9ARAC|nr:TMEM67 [Cordylochernes scorpioides]